MSALLSESALDVDRSLMVTVGDGNRLKGIHPTEKRLVIGAVPSTESEFEDHRRAYRHLTVGDKRRHRSRYRWLRESGEDTRVGKERGPCQLTASTPRPLGRLEIEPTLLSQERHEFHPAPRIDDLPQRGIDGVTQRRRA